MLQPFFSRLSQSIGALIFASLLAACAKEPPSTLYHHSGQTAQMVRCPVGEYEICLQQLSNACQKNGYSIAEKVRQVKSGVWSDTGEILIVAQCNNPSK